MNSVRSFAESSLTRGIKPIGNKRKLGYTFNVSSIHLKDKSKIELTLDENPMFAMRKSYNSPNKSALAEEV